MRAADLIVGTFRDHLRTWTPPLTDAERARAEAIVAAWDAEELTELELAQAAARAWIADAPADDVSRLVALTTLEGGSTGEFVMAFAQLPPATRRRLRRLWDALDEDE